MSELSPDDIPYTLGLDRLVDLDQEADFIGKSALQRIQKEGVKRRLVGVEIAVGVAGGTAGLLLFYAFTFLGHYLPVLILSSLLVGALVGLEIPLVIRILKERQALVSAVSMLAIACCI